MTQTDPLVSVVIPFLNAERFLRQAVESVLAQTYSSWEIFLVDDGSTDSSVRLARNYADRLAGRIHYLDHPGHKNLGTGASRNLGIGRSRGAYVAFLNSDDVWVPTKLAEQIAIIAARSEIAMVYGPSCWWYSWAESAEIPRMDGAGLGASVSRPPDEIEDMKLNYETVYDPPEMFVRVLRKDAHAPCPSNTLVRTKALRAVGGFENSFPNLAEDQVLWAKLFLRYPVFVSDKCWTLYRQHADSVMALAREQRKTRSLWLFFLQWLQTYLATQGVTDPRIWHSLQRELRRHKYPGLTRVSGCAHFVLQSVRRLVRRRIRMH